MKTETSISILNTGAGDINVSFNEHDEAEADRAVAMLIDMQKRGYAIMVRNDDGTYVRAVVINRETRSYVVIPPKEGSEPAAETDGARPKKSRRRSPKVEIPVRGRRATAVARSAGGCHQRRPQDLLRNARGDR